MYAELTKEEQNLKIDIIKEKQLDREVR